MADPAAGTRTYRNHHLDSKRWEAVDLRPGDVVVATAYKSGTTWMQTILAHLLFVRDTVPAPIKTLSPWIEDRLLPLDDVIATLEAQSHRRILKSHLSVDGIPYREDVSYIVVGRDTRDVFMSFFNHYSAYTPELLKQLNEHPGRCGDALPRCPDDLHVLWRVWMERGWFSWESDGWPFWSQLSQVAGWWPHRGRPNVLFVHFGDLLEDLDGGLRRIAAFLGLDVPEAAWPRLHRVLAFPAMRANADAIIPGCERSFQGGARRFFFRGTNGRWRGVFSDDELALYDRAAGRVLDPACRRWLEEGIVALDDAGRPAAASG